MRLALSVIGLLALLVSPAFAQDPTVQIDPRSPSAQEYSIPLERVRRQADPSGESQAQPPTVPAAPPFGEGIEAQASGAAGAGSRGDSDRSSDRNRKRSDRRERSSRAKRDAEREDGAQVPEAVVAAAQQPGPPAGGIGSTLLVGGVAAFVLVAGGLGGLALRRRSSE
jgi:hypothetical protein